MPSITLTFSAAHAQRMQAALEETFKPTDENGDPRPADINDLKKFVKTQVQDMVRKSERRVAALAARASISNVDIT